MKDIPPDAIEPPLGVYPARLDENGRVQLPEAFRQYLALVGGDELRVYWHGDHLEISPAATYQAERKGASGAAIDAEGPAKLRKSGLL